MRCDLCYRPPGPARPLAQSALLLVLLFNGCAGDYCKTCKGSFCTPLDEKFFSALVGAR